MSSAIQHRRGTTAQHATFTGLVGEITVDTTLDTAVIHDGATAGGFPLAKASDVGPGEIHASAEKSPPVDADEVGIVDSAASWVRKKITFANLKLFLFGSPALTGNPTAPTQSPGNDSTRLATTAFVQAATAVVVGTASAGMDTLGEIETAVALKAPLANPTFTGTPAAPTAAPGTNTTQVATTGFVKAAIDVILGGVSAAFDTLSEIATELALKATIASPTFTGDPKAPTATAGDNDTSIATTAFVKTADDRSRARRNRLVNPAMQISQENGNSSGTTSGYFPADQWAVYRVTSAGTITAQRVQSVTPKGAKDRLRVTITVADASLAAGEYLTVTQPLEGQEVADFQYGGASAKQSVLRFLFKGPAGTYAARLGNSAANRSYVATFSPASANVEEVITLVIPGDTSGTWLTDTGIGISLDIVLACGSTFQGTTGWQAGQIFGTSGVSNGMGTGSAVFEIGEAGLYLDPDATGVAPAWELPSYEEQFRKCLRYWETRTYLYTLQAGSYNTFAFGAPKRTSSPTVTVTGSTFSGTGGTADYFYATIASGPTNANVTGVANNRM